MCNYLVDNIKMLNSYRVHRKILEDTEYTRITL